MPAVPRYRRIGLPILLTARGLGATSPSPATIQQMIVAAANARGVPAALALGVAAHESNFNPNATNVNTNGTVDYGVMQLNTTTVKTLGVADPMDPQQNIDAGVGLLARYLAQYGGNTSDALWAYASGPGAVAKGGPPNSTASGFINFVEGYAPPAALGLPVDDGSTLDAVAAAAEPDTGWPDLTSIADGLDPAAVGLSAAIAGLALYALFG